MKYYKNYLIIIVLHSDIQTSSYEFDAEMEETYTQYLLKSFKKTLLDNLYDCVIVDCKNTSLLYLAEFHTIAKTKFFTVSAIIVLFTRRFVEISSK